MVLGVKDATLSECAYTDKDHFARLEDGAALSEKTGVEA